MKKGSKVVLNFFRGLRNDLKGRYFEAKLEDMWNCKKWCIQYFAALTSVYYGGTIPIDMNNKREGVKINMTYQERIQKEFDRQTGGDFQLDENAMTLLKEEEDCWIVLYKDGNRVINVVYKDIDKRMESLEY